MIAALFHRFGRLVRFGLVGVAVSLLYTVLTILFYKSGLIPEPTWASAAAFAISLPVSYVSHRRTTYADIAPSRDHWKRFGVIGLSSFIIAVGGMKIVAMLHWPYGIGLAIAWLLIPATNYAINALWVFRVPSFLALDATGSAGENQRNDG